jgi:peroxiredoxin
MTKQAKVAVGAAAAIVLVAGLYLANRYWIAPVTLHAHRVLAQGGDHPLAPTFTLTDLNGNKISLADYKGKVVILDFWATWCGPCRIEIPGFVDLQERYRKDGLAVIGVAVDDGPDAVRQFYKEFKMNYPVAMGTETVTALYGGLPGLPTTFLIGRDGRIYAKHSGAVDPEVFEEEVKELLSGSGNNEVASFQPVARTDKVTLGDPEKIAKEDNPEVPGIDISGLTPARLAAYKKQISSEKCDCGCNMNVLECRHEHHSCEVSKKLANEALKSFAKS